MKPGKIKYIIFLSAGILLISCSPRVSKSVLNFFFDGVPEPIVADFVSEQADPKVDSLILISSAGESVIPQYHRHAPYLNKECKKCHDPNSVGDLITPEPELCHTCHNNEDIVYKYLHGPIEVGYCSSCHDPHGSRNNKLLVLPGNDLCYYCHNPGNLVSPEPHKLIHESECTDCHNPHGSNNKFLLIQSGN